MSDHVNLGYNPLMPPSIRIDSSFEDAAVDSDAGRHKRIIPKIDVIRHFFFEMFWKISSTIRASLRSKASYQGRVSPPFQLCNTSLFCGNSSRSAHPPYGTLLLSTRVQNSSYSWVTASRSRKVACRSEAGNSGAAESNRPAGRGAQKRASTRKIRSAGHDVQGVRVVID